MQRFKHWRSLMVLNFNRAKRRLKHRLCRVRIRGAQTGDFSATAVIGRNQHRQPRNPPIRLPSRFSRQCRLYRCPARLRLPLLLERKLFSRLHHNLSPVQNLLITVRRMLDAITIAAIGAVLFGHRRSQFNRQVRCHLQDPIWLYRGRHRGLLEENHQAIAAHPAGMGMLRKYS